MIVTNRPTPPPVESLSASVTASVTPTDHDRIVAAAAAAGLSTSAWLRGLTLERLAAS